MGKRHSIRKLTQTEYTQIRDLFHSDLSAGEISENYNLDISVVTFLFKKEYPLEEVKERTRKRHKNQKSKMVTAICEGCNKEFSLKKRALVQMKKRVICPDCRFKVDFKTHEERICPICDLRVHGKQGLTGHVKHLAFKKDDQAHLDYFNQEEAKKWEGQILNIHYVECQICKETGEHFSDYRRASLHRHIRSTHKMTIPEYKVRYPGHVAIAEEAETKRANASAVSRALIPPESYKETKSVNCILCAESFQVSKYRSDTQYPIICPVCKRVKLEEEYLECWKDKVEGVDYVECKVPNCSAKPLLGPEFPFRTERSLKEHLRFEHSLKPKAYEAQYESKHYIENKMPGCGVLRQRLEEERKQREVQGLLVTEVNFCIICGEKKEPVEILKNLCLECIGREEDQEGNLYCKFSGCNFKSSYLSSHVIKIHKISTTDYCAQFPGSYFVSSKVRKKMSKGGGWSKGLTKETNPGMAKISENTKGIAPWSSGLTKETDGRIKKSGQKVHETKSSPNWIPPGPRIFLTLEDFKPYLNAKDELIVGMAVRGLKLAYPTIVGKAKGLGLKLKFRRPITQTIIMELLSKITKQSFTSEQSFDSMRNPETNYPFRFDGYFSALDLIVEYHGYQHYLFPNHVHKNIVDFKVYQDRDYLKRELAIHNGYFYLVVRFDEPYEDIKFLKSKLKEAFGGTSPWTSTNLSEALKKARSNLEIPFLL